MTTTTSPDVIEGIDLDAVPVCEKRAGCAAPAVWVWFLSHGCTQLLCDTHRLTLLRRHASYSYPKGFECVWCGHEIVCSQPSELGRLVAL